MRCGLLLQTELYRCKQCFEDSFNEDYGNDWDMCKSCKDEHDDANDNNQWETIYNQ